MTYRDLVGDTNANRSRTSGWVQPLHRGVSQVNQRHEPADIGVEFDSHGLELSA
jgi:hypothetical protein